MPMSLNEYRRFYNSSGMAVADDPAAAPPAIASPCDVCGKDTASVCLCGEVCPCTVSVARHRCDATRCRSCGTHAPPRGLATTLLTTCVRFG